MKLLPASKYLLSIALLFSYLPAIAGVTGASDRVNAKLSRTKAKIKSMSYQERRELESRGELVTDDQLGCGQVDIGSVHPGPTGAVPREVTVIIDGDVINSPKCK